MSASVDEVALDAELEAVREASRAGEIVAVSPEEERSMARYVAVATLKLGAFVLALLVAVVALAIWGAR